MMSHRVILRIASISAAVNILKEKMGISKLVSSSEKVSEVEKISAKSDSTLNVLVLMDY